jgi:hypothetical protein
MPFHEEDVGLSYLQNHYRIGIHDQEVAQLRKEAIAQEVAQLIGGSVSASRTVSSAGVPIAMSVTACEEESRIQTEMGMLLYPRQKAFMERVMPIEWCRARYPKVYEQR